MAQKIKLLGKVNRELLTNAEILEYPKNSNAIKFVVNIAEAFGVDNIGYENDHGSITIMADKANELLALLNGELIKE